MMATSKERVISNLHHVSMTANSRSSIVRIIRRRKKRCIECMSRNPRIIVRSGPIQKIFWRRPYTYMITFMKFLRLNRRT